MKQITHIFEDAEQTAYAVAKYILVRSNEKKNISEPLNIAVSGGSTPKQLFHLLASDEFSKAVSWESLRIFWVDERCVPPTDKESNYGMTYDALLRFPFVNSDNIFRMKGENQPDEEAIRYAELLAAELPVRHHFPVFDLILLGIGDDGHTASIFPNSMDLLHSDKSVAVGIHPISGQKRITLTGKTINNAEEVIFLVNGANKLKITHHILHQTPASKNYPASFVGNSKGEAVFYLDKAAVGDDKV